MKMDTANTHQRTDRLLPFSEARKLVGISRSHIYARLERGEFPCPVKIGRCNYFSERELREWIARKLSQREVKLCK